MSGSGRRSNTSTFTNILLLNVTLTAFKNRESMETSTTILMITVEHGILDHVKMIPSTLGLEVNESRQFAAEAMDFYDNPVPEAQITWEVEERAGSITNNGLFTAGTKAGIFDAAIIVMAHLDGHSVRTITPINVKHGPLDRVKVTPSVVTLGVGESQQFTAEVMDAYGNSIPEAQLTWEVEEGAGSITSKGLYTAGPKAGKGVTVIATLNDNSVKGVASITLKPGPLHYVKLIPETAGLYYDQSQQFTAEAFDAYDNPIPDVQLAWEVVTEAGTITSDGLFTAGTGTGTLQATVVVTAKSSGLSASAAAVVTISEQLNKFMTYLGMNTKVPYMLNDPKVRRAISLCLDRDKITAWVIDTYSNDAQKVLSIVSPTLSNTNISPNQDITKAKELLWDVGYPNGFKVHFYVLSELVNVAQKVKTYLANVGIDAQIVERVNTISLIPSSAEEPYFFLTSITVDSPDTFQVLGRLLLSTSIENVSGFSDSGFDQLFNSGSFREAEDIAFKDNSGSIIHLYWSSR